MTTPHRTLQMALDALEWLLANIRRNAPDLSGKAMGNAEAAIAALREALDAPEPEPVAWYYVEDPWGANEWHFMADSPESQECDPRDWTPLYAAPPAAPAPAAPVPDGWVMVPREPTEDMIQAAAGAWGESEGGLHNAFAAALRGGITASPAAHVVPLTEGRITGIANELAFGGGHCNVYELARAIEKARGITGGKP